MQHVSGVAVIPARGGSRRVPGKNTRLLDGIPAIAHVIEACKASGVVERIVVSTDDREIAEIAQSAGAQAPFIRPAELADDHTGILPVVQHAVAELNVDANTPIACVYATAVSLAPSDLAAAHKQLFAVAPEAFIVSVTEFDAPIQRALMMADNGSVTFIDPAAAHTRSQDLPPRWHDAGQFIWGQASTWLQAASVWDSAIGFPVPHWRVVDIDTEADWRRAELVIAMLQRSDSDR